MKVAARSKEDPVDRLKRFQAAHPEITITPPCLANGPYWKAHKGEEFLTDAYWLEWFMDKLDKLFPLPPEPGTGADGRD